MNSITRLEEIIKRKIGNKKFIVASHSEPYIHYYAGDEIKWRKANGGLVTALDPVMQACGGTWVAYSAADADAEVVDKKGVVQVPPNAQQYSLKRVTLDKEDVSMYLDGVAHSSIWPWCHFAYIRPEFKDERWPYYKKVNKIFADAILDSIGEDKAFVWIQDYHLALVAKYVKEKRPDIVVAQFWHVPWPNPEVFKIAPWNKEIGEALLYNDLLGFQTRLYANQFLDSIDQLLQARVDREQSAIYYRDSKTLVKEFPISIDINFVQKSAQAVTEDSIASLKKKLGITSEKMCIGVDRLDYAKGLVEKMKVIDAFLQKNPEWTGRLTLVQIASPTRSHVKAYHLNAETVFSLADDINEKWQLHKWKPIILLNGFQNFEDLLNLYTMADCCLITSLHDGMNLVAKEYVSINQDGVLLLSKFTGASRELQQAIPINPYAINETASALKKALEMPLEERRMRMKKMENEVRDNDVFKWAADFISHIAKLESTVVYNEKNIP